MPTNTEKRDAVLTQIAVKHLYGVDTLETRCSDDLDFHDLAVWSLKAALEAAYEAGCQSAKGGAK